MNASIRTQVTFTNEELVKILKDHLAKDGLVMSGEVSISTGPNMLTVSNVDIFQHDPAEVVNSQGYSNFDLELASHLRRQG